MKVKEGVNNGGTGGASHKRHEPMNRHQPLAVSDDEGKLTHTSANNLGSGHGESQIADWRMKQMAGPGRRYNIQTRSRLGNWFITLLRRSLLAPSRGYISAVSGQRTVHPERVLQTITDPLKTRKRLDDDEMQSGRYFGR